jgi:hypothetical protein
MDVIAWLFLLLLFLGACSRIGDFSLFTSVSSFRVRLGYSRENY